MGADRERTVGRDRLPLLPAQSVSAAEGTRTPKPARARRPERRVFTNFTTAAEGRRLAFTGAESMPNGASATLQRLTPLSSRGLGRRPLTAVTRVRIPVAVLTKALLTQGFSVSGGPFADQSRESGPAKGRTSARYRTLAGRLVPSVRARSAPGVYGVLGSRGRQSAGTPRYTFLLAAIDCGWLIR